jgi:hypothetical protein
MAPGEYGPCAVCDKVVHDLRRMSEREVVDLLARSHGSSICVAYRTRSDGSIVLRDEPRARPGVLAILLAAACAGHGPAAGELERCRDDDGAYVDCARSGPSWAFTAVPDEVAAPPPPAPQDDGWTHVEVDVPPPIGEVPGEIVPEGVQTTLEPVPEGQGCPPPWEGELVGQMVSDVEIGDVPVGEGLVVGGIESRPSLRDRGLARKHRREIRQAERADRRAARKASRASR